MLLTIIVKPFVFFFFFYDGSLQRDFTVVAFPLKIVYFHVEVIEAV